MTSDLLTQLLEDPTRVSDLSPEALADLYQRVALLEARLRAQLLTNGRGALSPAGGADERVLRLDEAAVRLGMRRSTLHRKWKTIPGAYKDPVDGRLKFSLRALERYQHQGRR